MESIRRFTSVRRPKTARPGTSPTLATTTEKPVETAAPAPQRQDDVFYSPSLTLTRTDSNFVDPSDPAAAVAAAAAEMVVGLVRRAKSTRGPRRMNSTAAPTSRPVLRERTRSLDLPTHMDRLDQDQSEAPKTTLKSRPSIRDRFKSRMGKPASISITPPVPCSDPKTPTDPQFRYRPKRGGADLSHIAATLQVPRDSQDGPPSPGYNRLSFEKSGGEDTLSMTRTKSEKEPAQLSPEVEPELNRTPGECRRCHSKRVQRTLSARNPTAGERIFGAPTDVKRPMSDGSTAKDVFGDYKFVVTGPETLGDTKPTETKTPTSPIPVVITDSERTLSLPSDKTRGHVKQAPSWASYNDGDSDGDKVKEHRKSLQPLLSHPPPNRVASDPEKPPQVLPPRMLRRQRSVAQRIVDYIRPASKRSGSVKVKTFF